MQHGEKTETLSFHCGPMEAGRWTVRFWQRKISQPLKSKITQPLIYSISMTFLPSKSTLDSTSTKIDLLQSDWQLDKVVQISDEKRSKLETKKDVSTAATTTTTSAPISTTTTTTSEKCKSCTDLKTISELFFDWTLCGGGLITLVLAVQFVFLWLVQPIFSPLRPNRVHRRWYKFTCLILLIVSAFQFAVRINYCR